MDWASILIQIPVVGVFVYFTLSQQKMNQEAMAKRDQFYQEAQEKRDQAYLTALADISKTQRDYNVEFNKAVAMMVSRTRPRKLKEEA